MADDTSKNSGGGIDTGTGGFTVGPDQNLVTYDVGAASPPGGKWSPGQVAVDNSIKDLTPETKKTLANYLSRATLGQVGPSTRPNKYPVQNSATDNPTSLKLTDEKGYPQQLTSDLSAQPHYSDIGIGRSNDSVSLNLLRGRQEATSEKKDDGNDLLKKAAAALNGAENPPPRGTVNIAGSRSKTVDDYTKKVLSHNSETQGFNTPDKVFKDNYNALRPLDKVVSSKSVATESTTAKHLESVTKDDTTGDYRGIGYSDAKNDYTVTSPATHVFLVDNGHTPSLRQLTDSSSDHFVNTTSITGGRSVVPLTMTKGKSGASSEDSPNGHTLLSNSVTNATDPTDPLYTKRGGDPAQYPKFEELAPGPVRNYYDLHIKLGSDEGTYTFDKQFSAKLLGKLPEINLRLRDPKSIVPNEVRPDFSTKTLVTLGDYLVDVTNENTYNLFDVKLPEENAIRKDPAKPSQTIGGFLTNDNFTGRSLSAVKPPASGHELLVKATGDDIQRAQINPSVTDGALPTVKFGAPAGDYASYSSSLIKNRFNSDQQWSSYDDGSRQFKDKSTFDKGLGGPSVGAGQNTLGTSLSYKDARQFTFRQLAQIGTSLSLRAGAELNTDKGDNPTSGGAQAGSLLPGWSQMGLKRVSRDDLTAKRVLDDLIGVPGIDDAILIDPLADSWGTMNNPHDQFSGLTAFGMILLSISLLIALTVAIVAITAIFTIFPSAKVGETSDAEGRKPYGAFEADPDAGDYSSLAGIAEAIMARKFNLWRMIGMQSTRYTLETCLPVGALVFFGVSVSPGDSAKDLFKKLGPAALNTAQNPGYYAVMARAVNRSFLLIGDAFANLPKAFSAGGVSGVQQIIGLLEVFRDSKFFRAVNVFAQLGDRVLRENSKGEGYIKDLRSLGMGIRHKSIIDSLDNNTSGMKSRLKPADTTATNPKASPLTLAWSTARATDMLLIPKSVLSLSQFDLDSTTGDTSTTSTLRTPSFITKVPIDNEAGIKNGGVYKTSDVGRLSTAEREQFEDLLESEYMPFYLHDIRTNEIVSFHAFLASLSDDYSASYDSVEAFGRVEPIKSYKGTQRKIGFSFHLVATNPNDFDSMWLKINKLTTLVYPQFNEGRVLQDKDKRYTMYAPFSQTIQAAPLVRLRIGDVISSNYSKFNLARMFGYSYEGTQFGGEQLVTGSSASANPSVISNKLNELRQTKGEKFTTGKILERASSGDESLLGKLAASIPGLSKEEVPARPHTLPPGYYLEIVSDNYNLEKSAVVVKVVEDLTGTVTGTKLTDPVKGVYSKQPQTENTLKDRLYYIHPSELIPVAETLKKAHAAVAVASTAQKYHDAAAIFMNDTPNSTTNGNVLAKSFRTSGGRGLAGFIDSMNFDWYDKANWEIGYGAPIAGDVSTPVRGRRAPMMCKVTISFTPVHDIAPGLDHVGFNRAPLYPVGPMYTPPSTTKT